jgi:hypothetical protein
MSVFIFPNGYGQLNSKLCNNRDGIYFLKNYELDYRNLSQITLAIFITTCFHYINKLVFYRIIIADTNNQLF